MPLWIQEQHDNMTVMITQSQSEKYINIGMYVQRGEARF